MRVLIADDHPQMLAAMVHAVESDDRFELVGTATNGHDALELATRCSVDVALLDVRMPGGGPAAVAAFHTLPYPPAVVAISAENTVGTVAAMVRAGAVGYLTKGRIGESLPEVLIQCAAGEVVLATGSGAAALRLVSGG
ncbi:MAG: response regulator transcription factor [Pedococcus sp.]